MTWYMTFGRRSNAHWQPLINARLHFGLIMVFRDGHTALNCEACLFPILIFGGSSVIPWHLLSTHYDSLGF